MFSKYILQTLYKYKRKLFTLSSIPQANANKKFNVLFFGSDSFSLPSLKLLINERNKNSCVNEVAVVTSYKSPANPVKKFADKHVLSTFDWPLHADHCSRYDIGIVVSFGHLIPASIISAFPFGMINLHASMLPRWRGAAPIIYAIMRGDRTTGVTIMKIMPEKFDVGDVIAQRAVPIEPDILMPDLHNQLAEVGSHLLVDCVKRIPNSLLEAKPQDNAVVSYAPKVTQSNANVRWDLMSAEQVYNLYRAMYSFKPVTTRWQQHLVKLIEVRIDRNEGHRSDKPPGTVEYVKGGKYLRVFCADGGCISVHKLGIEGKKIMSAMDFNNGFVKKVATTQHCFCF